MKNAKKYLILFEIFFLGGVAFSVPSLAEEKAGDSYAGVTVIILIAALLLILLWFFRETKLRESIKRLEQRVPSVFLMKHALRKAKRKFRLKTLLYSLIVIAIAAGLLFILIPSGNKTVSTGVENAVIETESKTENNTEAKTAISDAISESTLYKECVKNFSNAWAFHLLWYYPVLLILLVWTCGYLEKLVRLKRDEDLAAFVVFLFLTALVILIASLTIIRQTLDHNVGIQYLLIVYIPVAALLFAFLCGSSSHKVKIFWGISVAFIIGAGISATVSNWTTPSDYVFEKALTYLEESQYEEACDLYQNILVHDDFEKHSKCDTLNNLALCEMYLGNLEDAEYYEQLLFNENPTDSRYVINLLVLGCAQGETSTEILRKYQAEELIADLEKKYTNPGDFTNLRNAIAYNIIWMDMELPSDKIKEAFSDWGQLFSSTKITDTHSIYTYYDLLEKANSDSKYAYGTENSDISAMMDYLNELQNGAEVVYQAEAY